MELSDITLLASVFIFAVMWGRLSSFLIYDPIDSLVVMLIGQALACLVVFAA